MKLNVFVDFHHASLLNSLILLFEKRLGGAVFRPIGLEWAEKGFWHIYDHPATREQYLGIGGNTPDGSAKLNEVIGKNNGIYACQDIDSGKQNKAITFDAFMQMDIDIVIASIPQHVGPFKKLCALHPNHPKLIYQIGNAWNIPPNSVQNVMASAIIPSVPSGVNFVSYHQEFDLDIFRPTPFQWAPDKNIYSFVNCFDTQDHFKFDWAMFQEMETLMAGWYFKVYGGQCRDGVVAPASEVANRMREARFIWHTKAGGDGYGHVIHNAFAVGRPPIVKKSYYQGKLAEALMVHGETCIDIDGLSFAQIKELIHRFGDDEDIYNTMSQAAYNKFKEIVDFEKEALSISKFLEKIL